MAVLSAKFGFDDPDYKIIPRGCFSKIITKEGKKYLYMTNNENDFNDGLVALLEFVNKFCGYIFVLVGSSGNNMEVPRQPQYF